MIPLSVGRAHPRGPLRALHGVNNGPIAYGGLVDVTDLYLDAQIPFVRIHDPHWPHAWEIDVHTIFPDFDNDPLDPASYDFRRSDDYIEAVVATGASIVYRLGESIEHTRTKYFVHPPRDAERWAQICVGIIRHYNEGWADGHRFGIRHWEIWNEADNPDRGVMWSGSYEDYLDLYAAASRAIKSACPDVLVGGPAATMVSGEHPRRFLERCRDEHLPMDFFSWHTYTGDVGKLVSNAADARRWLVEFGFPDAEIHLNEWNYEPPPPPAGGAFRSDARRKFGRIKGAEGAAYVAAVLCELQDTDVTVANYYDGQPNEWYCGLFDDYGNPLPPYDVLKGFAELLETPTRLTVSGTEAAAGLHAIAVAEGTLVRALIVNASDRALEVAVSGLGAVDGIRTVSAAAGREVGHGADARGTRLTLPPYSVSIVRASRAADEKEKSE